MQLTKPMEEALLTFIEYHPPARVSRVLRRMLVQWLMPDSAVEERDFRDIMYDVEGVFELLDGVGE